jgi:hypothetical protein
VEDHLITFDLLDRHSLQFSPAEKRTLWLACTSPHPTDSLRAMQASIDYGSLRYCPKCFVAFAADGRPINGPTE